MIFGKHEVLNKPYKMDGLDHKNNAIIHLKWRHYSHCCASRTAVTPYPIFRMLKKIFLIKSQMDPNQWLYGLVWILIYLLTKSNRPLPISEY